MSKLQIKFISLFAGIVISLLLYFINPFNVDDTAAKVLAIAGLMITWWVTDAIPMPVVALIPLVLIPLLNIAKLETTAAPYANPVIFLFMGGLMLGLAIEKWNLHRRIALNIVRLTGTSGNRIILGFILATGLLSMWLSNTATTVMMLPIALSVIHVMKENNKGAGNIANFSLTLMLAIAYASNIGGIATIVGTPPNVAYVGYINKKYGYDISFLDWMLLCLPIAILLLGAMYFVMVKWLFPNRIKSDEGTKELIKSEIRQLGALSVPEKRVLLIFIVTAFLWMFRSIINELQSTVKLDDTIIALICGITLFICPSGSAAAKNKVENNESLLEWGDTKRLAWGILLLFGGGISLANAMENAGLMEQFVLVLVITIVSMFISEVMSNIAQVIVFAPVVSSLADAIGINPLMLGIPMALAASVAGMMPMGTPPNAIVFASGHIKFRQMAKAGFVMNLVAVVLITVFCWFFIPLLMKV